MRTRRSTWSRGSGFALLAGFLLLGLASLGCSGNRRVSVGGSVAFGSGGAWGHGISVGIHSHGRRR